jgi:hypothetical protein
MSSTTPSANGGVSTAIGPLVTSTDKDRPCPHWPSGNTDLASISPEKIRPQPLGRQHLHTLKMAQPKRPDRHILNASTPCIGRGIEASPPFLCSAHRPCIATCMRSRLCQASSGPEISAALLGVCAWAAGAVSVQPPRRRENVSAGDFISNLPESQRRAVGSRCHRGDCRQNDSLTFVTSGGSLPFKADTSGQ